MCSALLKSRVFVFTLTMVLVFASLSAEGKVSWGEIVKTFPQELQKDLELAERLDQYGYDKSALHYLKKIYRTAELSETQLKLLGEEIERQEKKISESSPSRSLPDLEVMLHFDPPQLEDNHDIDLDTISLTETEHLRPESFPSNRINKKKWLIRSLITVGVGIIIYKVNENMKKKPEAQPNTVVIEF